MKNGNRIQSNQLNPNYFKKMSKINSKISFKFQSKIFGPEANNKGKGRKRRHPSWTRWGRALEEAEADLPDTKDGRQASGGKQKEHSGLLSRAQIDFFFIWRTI